MIRVVVALLGLALIGAVFAAVYYSSDETWREEGFPAYSLAPGEVRSDSLQPTEAGTPILVQVNVVGGPIDIYVMKSDWAQSTVQSSRIDLSRPFSYDAGSSLVGVDGRAETLIISDGQTRYNLVFDHTDNYYVDDAVPRDVASIHVTARFLAEEERSLALAYLAATPSIVLVAITFWKWRRIKAQTGETDSGAE